MPTVYTIFYQCILKKKEKTVCYVKFKCDFFNIFYFRGRLLDVIQGVHYYMFCVYSTRENISIGMFVAIFLESLEEDDEEWSTLYRVLIPIN